MENMTGSETAMAIDPVCGMKVDIGAPAGTATHEGHKFYFCSEGCRTKFAADPERYLTKRGEAKPLQWLTGLGAPRVHSCLKRRQI